MDTVLYSRKKLVDKSIVYADVRYDSMPVKELPIYNKKYKQSESILVVEVTEVYRCTKSNIKKKV